MPLVRSFSKERGRGAIQFLKLVEIFFSFSFNIFQGEVWEKGEGGYNPNINMLKNLYCNETKLKIPGTGDKKSLDQGCIKQVSSVSWKTV